MGIDLGSLKGLVGKEDSTLAAVSGMLGWMKDLTSGLGYFLGGDFQKALGGGFMK